MEKRQKQIIIIFISIVLILATFVAVIFCGSGFCYTPEDEVAPLKSIENLKVVLDYNPNAAYKEFNLNSIISEADFIFKGTVIESTIDRNEKEVLLAIDDVLKGDLNPETITVFSNYKPLNFETGNEFIFFVSELEGNYSVMTTQGYLKNTGLKYEGLRFGTTYDVFKEKVAKSNAGIIDPVDPVIIDTLEVTYWNPWGGPTLGGYTHMDYPIFTLSEYVSDSTIIVSATVVDSTRWTDETEKGKAKLKTFGSPWTYPYGTEYSFRVNDVLKGNFEIDNIHLKTDMNGTVFTNGKEYVLFLRGSESGNSYWVRETEGYLVKNGSNYEGMYSNISISKSELKSLASFSSLELTQYQSMAFSSNVFIGEMLTSTDADKLEQFGQFTNLESSQLHQVRVISPIKGNLSGTVDFRYEGAYITNKMMDDYLAQEQWTLENVMDSNDMGSNSSGYYRSYFWDPKVSPLKAGDIRLICLSEYEGEYYVWASKTDYRINERNEKELRKLAEDYQKTLNEFEKYLVYSYE